MALAIQIRNAGLGELADELKRLEKRRQNGGLGLGEARLWRELHTEILHRLTAHAPAGERREALRVPCAVQVGNQTGSWLAKNFGPGGLGIHGTELPAVGTEVALDWIAVDGKHRKFPVTTRVAWMQDQDAGLEIRNEHARYKVVEAMYSMLLEAFLRDA